MADPAFAPGPDAPSEGKGAVMVIGYSHLAAMEKAWLERQATSSRTAKRLRLRVAIGAENPRVDEPTSAPALVRSTSLLRWRTIHDVELGTRSEDNRALRDFSGA
jgi:hypothetical protein